MISIKVQLHQYLLYKCLIWYSIAQLYHLPVVAFAIEELVEEMRLLLLGDVDDRRVCHSGNRLDLLLRCIQAGTLPKFFLWDRDTSNLISTILELKLEISDTTQLYPSRC